MLHIIVFGSFVSWIFFSYVVLILALESKGVSLM